MNNSPELNRYRVIDTMELGPVMITPNSARISCRVTMDGQVHERSWGYRYGETVFDPQCAADRNLAALMTVQTAMNYGLFCRQIVFRDRFDDADRQFIVDVMENTSREIVVKKLHEHNPFLLPGWQLQDIPLSPVYTQAELVFPSDEEQPLAQNWSTRDNAYCILSSGGKESLLSFGLLKELSCECHPIYINESGRHWFTALNGYRGFRAVYPETARVWTDCDRFFNWMLRRIGFIRPDFQRLRADDYPLRLWTVAVFLFGALPLLKKRGLSSLVVGNEYDTSRFFRHETLPHYDGLYDQSVWFDHHLSDFFSRKGWQVRVFSILRNLSETLVEKILAHRYPHLFSLQVSCHAALIKGNLVKPCGRCEKCRRIMAILTAIGVDPGRIGYSPAMTEAALWEVKKKGLHSQLPGEFAQVLKLLGGTKQAQEIEHLRLREDTASTAELPQSIRDRLMRLLGTYSKGSLIWEKDAWRRLTAAD